MESNRMVTKFYKVKLKPLDLDTNLKTQEFNIGDKITFNLGALKDTELTINKLDFSTKFNLQYRFCASPTYCYTSSEYLSPNLTGNYDKSLMRIEADAIFKQSSINKLSTIITKLSKVEYELDNTIIQPKVRLNLITPKFVKEKNTYYFEVDRDLAYTDKATLYITLRNTTYKFIFEKQDNT
jgi:hypothetical protein